MKDFALMLGIYMNLEGEASTYFLPPLAQPYNNSGV